MMLAMLFGVILLQSIVLSKKYGPFGGIDNVTDLDKDNLKEAKELIKETLEKRLKDDNYSPRVDLEQIEAKVQMVAGYMYYLKYKATYTFLCNGYGNGCLKKKPEVKTCTAKVLKPPGYYGKEQPARLISEANALVCS